MDLPLRTRKERGGFAQIKRNDAASRSSAVPLIAFYLVSTFAVAAPGAAFAQDDREIEVAGEPGQATGRVTIYANKSKAIRLRYPYADATVGSPEIADIVPISDRQLYIVGKKLGRTNILLFDREKRLIGAVDVDVKMDTAAIAAEVRSETGGSVRTQEVDGNVVLKGSGRDAPAVTDAMNVARLTGAPVVNAMRLKGSQQVMLKVRFVEASRSAIRSLGVRWQAILNNRVAAVVGANGSGAGRLVNSGMLAGLANRPGGPIVPGGAAAFGVPPGSSTIGGVVLDAASNTLTRTSPVATIITQLVNTGAGSLDVVLSALEERGVLRSLAEPNLVALSGETAEFMAGGEIPVPIAQTVGNVGGVGVANPTISVQWKPFGVRLMFTPTVLADKVISLRMTPEVSDLDYTNGVTVQGFQIPAITVRRANTTVELRDGQSFAIAGMIQAKSVRDIEQLPWLGSVPVLGALFRSTQFINQETELVALVTPYLVKPVPPGNKDPRLKTPLETALPGNDFDLFLKGEPEIAKNTPTTVTPTGMEQPIEGGIAPGAPGPQPPSLSPVDSIQSFFGALSAQNANPQQ